LNEPANIEKLTEHLFRHESGKMVAVLTKIFGTENLQTAEDVVQDTLLQALQVWKFRGIPDHPAAWLFRVAKNKAIDRVRRNKHSVAFDFSDADKILLTSEYTVNAAMEKLWRSELVSDDQLNMMFACCHPGISAENQITLILKTLCGFSTAEIASAFLTSEETISKRLYRTKEFFRKEKIRPALPPAHELLPRTHSVLNAVYLLFNEGYYSVSAEEILRIDLMDEALMLGKLIAGNPRTRLPENFALLALMCFHYARNKSRVTSEGSIILLHEQDRSQWDQSLIAQGNEWMNQSAFGQRLTTYHLEAAIAYEHCAAHSFEETNWPQILRYYNALLQITTSPVVMLNRVIAVMMVNGAAEADRLLSEMPANNKADRGFFYCCVKAEVLSRLNRNGEALQYYREAETLARNAHEKKLLEAKVSRLM
jgi:RNA polymerase sigma-70 factor (ECF subfamily)